MCSTVLYLRKQSGIMIIFLQSKELRIVIHFISFITNWINVFSIS